MRIETLEVLFQEREDGGLRAWCPQIPLFVLSHSDPLKVIQDVVPALETMLSARENCTVRVSPAPLESEPSPDWARKLGPSPTPRRRFAAECFAA
jgi:hypothetical protein